MEKQPRITIVVKHPKQEPKMVVVDNELDVLQGIVDGYIEIAGYIDTDTLVICNEEGKLRDLEPNIWMHRRYYEVDTIVGTVFAVKFDGEEFVDMTEDDAIIAMSWLNMQRV